MPMIKVFLNEREEYVKSAGVHATLYAPSPGGNALRCGKPAGTMRVVRDTAGQCGTVDVDVRTILNLYVNT